MEEQNIKVLNAINFEIYSTENRKSLKSFKQGCQTIIFAFKKNFPVVGRVGEDSEGVKRGNGSRTQGQRQQLQDHKLSKGEKM